MTFLCHCEFRHKKHEAVAPPWGQTENCSIGLRSFSPAYCWKHFIFILIFFKAIPAPESRPVGSCDSRHRWRWHSQRGHAAHTLKHTHANTHTLIKKSLMRFNPLVYLVMVLVWPSQRSAVLPSVCFLQTQQKRFFWPAGPKQWATGTCRGQQQCMLTNRQSKRNTEPPAYWLSMNTELN